MHMHTHTHTHTQLFIIIIIIPHFAFNIYIILFVQNESDVYSAG